MSATAAKPVWHSAIYRGRIRHRRLKPKHHEFSYSMFMLYLDLDELPGLFDQSRLYSAHGFALAQFRREDHLGDVSLPLDQSVRDLAELHSGSRPMGPIRLLTHLRYFGYCFNPVSFYYCFDPDGKKLSCVIAEVNNTPWGEQHCYVLDHANDLGQDGLHHWQQYKQMHVSPFMPLDMSYHWRLMQPDRMLNVYLQNHQDGNMIFDAGLQLQRQEITPAALRKILLRFPCMTLSVMFAIHWQALRLWLKGVPVHDHPGFTTDGAPTDSHSGTAATRESAL